jgi:lysophospholipase L1-like esterase
MHPFSRPAPAFARRLLLKAVACLAWAALLGTPALAGEPAGNDNASHGVSHNASDNANDSARWVGTWTASPQAAEPPGETIDNQTIRHVLRTSIAGNSVRVRLSNEFGTVPLVVGAATIARHAAGAAIVAGSDKPLRFGGRTSITLAPGAPALSDAVEFELPAVGDVVVSLYLPKASVPRTQHSLGVATAYISAPGDYSAAVVMPTARTAQSVFFLSGISVQATSPRSAAIVAFGDSITDGFASTPDANRRWPNLLAERLQARRGTAHLAVLNHGISGNRTLYDFIGPNAQARLDRDVLNAPGVKYLILLVGINNIGLPGAFGLADQAASAEDIIAGHKQIVARARERGIVVYGATLTPFEGTIFPGYYSAEGEVKRQAVNHWIRSGGAFDAVIDFDKAVRDPARPTRILPAYDSGDHLHPGDAGYRAMADFIDLRLFRSRSGGDDD